MPKALPLIYGATLILGSASFAFALPASPPADTGAEVEIVEFDNGLLLDIDDSDDRFGSDSDDGRQRYWRPQWDGYRALPPRTHDRRDFDDSDSDFDDSDSGFENSDSD